MMIMGRSVDTQLLLQLNITLVSEGGKVQSTECPLKAKARTFTSFDAKLFVQRPHPENTLHPPLRCKNGSMGKNKHRIGGKGDNDFLRLIVLIFTSNTSALIRSYHQMLTITYFCLYPSLLSFIELPAKTKRFELSLYFLCLL
jgi:hypothetical protein